ncbi:IPT/TIG domain-containing protein [Planotetraspora sp. GP83]|uniref:IPT/TIG domain-containing protein n=1 Tax=Planotetraspora sp. GP83 TaxID=3156264 RepID=UPI00351773EB
MAPVITSLSAAPQNTNQGSYGQTLTINGTGLAGATSARIGSRTVAASANLAGTVVTCTLPSGCGSVSVSVVTPTGTSNALPLYYIDPPFVSVVFPVEGSATTPVPVTISGETLLTSNRVQFSGVTATLIPPTSDVQITATPASITELGASPWFQVRNASVRTAGGTVTVANAIALYDTPAVTDLDPDTGAAGTSVIITGTGFAGSAISVSFDGVDADFSVNSDTQILATAPTGPTGAVNVVVTTPGGSSAPVTFTYV